MSRFSSLIVLVALVCVGNSLVFRPPTQPEKLQPGTATGCGFDVAFVLDRSESVTEINFPLVKLFVKQVVRTLLTQMGGVVGGEGMQFALVPFNTFANVHLYLNQSSSATDVFNAIDSLSYLPGLTNPFDAMDKVVNEVFTSARGDRVNQTNAIIFVSDGMRTKGTQDPTVLAQQFRQTQNGQVIAVGVNGLNGPHEGVFYQELVNMAGSPGNVFNVTSYAGLYGIFQDVSAKLNCH